MTPIARLAAIAEILEAVDERCLEADGPVTATRNEIMDNEYRRIYLLAKGDRRICRTRARNKRKAV